MGVDGVGDSARGESIFSPHAWLAWLVCIRERVLREQNTRKKKFGRAYTPPHDFTKVVPIVPFEPTGASFSHFRKFAKSGPSYTPLHGEPKNHPNL